MKAVVYHGVGDIRLDDVPEPRSDQADASFDRREQGWRKTVLRVSCAPLL